MTNRKWLESLSDEEFYDYVHYKITSVWHYLGKGKDKAKKTKTAFCKWLEAEHMEIVMEIVKENKNDE